MAPKRALRVCLARSFLVLIATVTGDAWPAEPLPAGTFYVSPQGNDAWSGRLPAAQATGADGPFATLDHARDAVRAQRAEGRLPAGDVTVCILPGEYVRTSTFELLAADSGTPDSRVIYRAQTPGTVRISGGVTLPADAFGPLTEPAERRRLPPAAQDRVLVADLKRLGITDYGQQRQYGHALPVCPAPLELFLDDEVMPLARYPNEGGMLIGTVIDPGSVPRSGDHSASRGATFEYTDARHERWVGVEDVWFRGTFNNGYADDTLRVESIDPRTRRVKLASPHLYGVASGQPYRKYVALNLLEELDRPGEWYLERPTGKLYFWPPRDLRAARIAVSLLEEPLIALEGVSGVTLQGLTVEVGRDSGIYLEGGSDNLIAGCTVRNLGTTGILMGQGSRQTSPSATPEDYEGVPVSRHAGNLQAHLGKFSAWDRNAGRHQGVVGCDIYNTGSGGVCLSGGRKQDLSPGGSYVENCRIHDYNRRNCYLWAGVTVDGCGNRVAHNEIFNSDFQAIYVHGNDHVFEFNVIHHVALDSDDTSVWYLASDPSDRGNVVRYNYVHHCGNPQRLTMGLYCDDATCGVAIYGNLFYHLDLCAGVVFSNAGHDLLVRDNLFCECAGPAVALCSMWYTWARDPAGGVPALLRPGGAIWRRLREQVDITRPPYATRYPELADWLDPLPDGDIVGMRPRRNLMERNVVAAGAAVLELSGAQAQFTDRNNLVLDGDPGFVSAADLDLRLREDALVYQRLPGFPPIPFGEIGLYRDAYRPRLPVPEPVVDVDLPSTLAPPPVRIRHAAGTEVFYTLDGQEPGPAATRYQEPLQIPPQDALLRAVAIGPEGRSASVSRFLHAAAPRRVEHVRISFQPPAAPLPEGWQADTGAPFGWQANGYVYGWSRNMAHAARRRARNPDPVLDTLIHFLPDVSWRILVENGEYDVTLGVGDPDYALRNQTLLVNEVTFCADLAVPPDRFEILTRRVQVRDGFLVIRSVEKPPDEGRLNYVEIRRRPPAPGVPE